MSNYRRFLIGGIGGLAPVLMFLVAVDWERYVLDAPTLKVIGYTVRVLVLFFIGGFVAYLHTEEHQPFKLFEVGLGAPALIAGAITTTLVPMPAKLAAPSLRPESRLSIAGVAFAQNEPDSQTLKTFSLPVQSPAAQFLEGLVGRTPQNVWFVIAGSHLRVEDAQTQATQLNNRYPEFRAEVYEPYGDNPYYAVVIGANLTQSEAKALRDKAVRAGVPKDCYYKTFPNLPQAGHAGDAQ